MMNHLRPCRVLASTAFLQSLGTLKSAKCTAYENMYSLPNSAIYMLRWVKHEYSKTGCYMQQNSTENH